MSWDFGMSAKAGVVAGIAFFVILATHGCLHGNLR
jgi:hypothetical protein